MKVRLNKKTKEELSTIPVLGTLQTKQKQVNEDITTYIDEPFLKPENIRHGITIAGVDGKYADVKYLNIYDVKGNHLRTLASTEPNPSIGLTDDSIYLTNKPFENQIAYNICADCFNYICYIKRDHPLDSGLPQSFNTGYVSFGPNTKQIDLVIAEGTISYDEAFINISTPNEAVIPYYVELPTKAYELGFDEDVAIGETSRMLVQRNSNYMEYNHYLSKLESAAPGLHKVSDTSFNGTSQVTVYETFSQRITVQYLEYAYNTIANSKVANHCELRVIEDSRTGEFRRTAFSNTGCGSSSTYDGVSFDNSAFIMLYDNAGTPSNLYKQSSTELKRWGGAMGFVYKLADGSFFIIDGGMGGTNEGYKNYRSQAPTLFNALKAYANDPNNIRIAGWLLTHSHQDHVGVFCEFMENTDYKSKISIDKVIYSLPVEKFSAFKVTKAAATRTEFETVLNILRAEGKTEIIKAHMGHIFNIQNLELTILSAPENVYRSYDPLTGNIISDIDNLNDTCVVCKVFCYSKNIFYLADAHKNQFQAHIVPALLGYIKSNIYSGGLQVAHHGYVDTNGKLLYDQLNESVDQPEFILWPVSYEHFWGKKTDGSVYQETEGTDYTGVYTNSKNAALKDIKAIYPVNNYSMVATPSTIGEWTFTAVDFVDPEPVWPNDSWTCPWCAFASGGASSLLGPGTSQCPDCGYPYSGKCISCGNSLIYGEDLHPPYCESCYNSGAGGQDTPHDYCAHCGTGIYDAEYKYCDKCGMICSNCTECGSCYVAACGADTRSKCILCGNYYCSSHSSRQNDGKCLRCKGIEFS